MVGIKNFGESSFLRQAKEERPFSYFLSVERAARLTVSERAFIAETKTRIVKHARTQTRGRVRTHARREWCRERRGIVAVGRKRGARGGGPRGEGEVWDGTIDRVGSRCLRFKEKPARGIGRAR